MYYDNDNVRIEGKGTANSTKPTKISEKQIGDFLFQERLNIQKNSGLKSESTSPVKSTLEAPKGVVNTKSEFPTPEIKSEQIQDIPLPDSGNNPSNENMNSWGQNEYHNVPYYSPASLPPHPGNFYVPTHLPPPGYSEFPSVQQWSQQPHPMGQYPPINTYYPTSSTTGYSVPPENVNNQSTESIGSQQTTVATDSGVTGGPTAAVGAQPSVKPTRFNIVDPRLIQNEEVLESTPQNFTPLQENSTDQVQ